MLAEQELRALAQLLNKTPMSQAELLWTQQFIDKLRAMIPAPQKEKDKQKEEDE